MKKLFYLIAVLLLTGTALPQGLIITKSDGTTVSFTLSEIDSMQFSTSAVTKPSSTESWNCYINALTAKTAPSHGIFEDTEEGIKISTGAHSGSTIILMPIQPVSLSDKSLYIRWRLENIDARVNLTLLQNELPNGTVITLSPQSTHLQSGVWYFSRITISGGTVNAVTCTENFSNNGGIVVAGITASLDSQCNNYAFSITSTGNAAAVLAETRIE